MASISSTGIGSGIDVGSLVSSLVAAEGAGKTARFDRREAEYTAKLSSLSALKAAVSDFQTSYTSLKSVSTFTALSGSTSDSKVFTVSADKAAISGSYSIDVTQLAVAQKLQTSTGYADSDTTIVGTGTLTFAFASDIIAGNGVTKDVTISDGTLKGIQNAINGADLGVNANIVFDGSSYQMVLTSQTGLDNRLTITSTGTLSDFDYDSDPTGAPPTPVASGNFAEAAGGAALDAIMTIDGVGITSATNTISTAIKDVTLTLEGIGTSETLSISKNTSAIGSAVQGFVDGYNALMTQLNSSSAYKEDGDSGILIGDSSVRGMVSQLRSILNTTVGDRNTAYNSLGSIGILTQRDGTLEYDSTKLSTALIASTKEVQYLLAGGKSTISNSSISVIGVPESLASGNYSVNIGVGSTQGTLISPQFFARAGDNRFDLSAGYNFQVSVDGATSNVLSINTNFYTGGLTEEQAGNAAAAAIQSAINSDSNISGKGGVAVKFIYLPIAPGNERGQISITSNSYGAPSKVSMIANLSKFGLNTTIVPTDGVDGSGTIGGDAATFSGDILTGTGKYADLVLDTNGASGVSSISITSGLMSNLETLVSGFLNSDGIITSKTDGLNSSIADITEARKVLSERLSKYETRLLKQFNAMDTLVAQLNTTSSFLTNQLGALSNLSNRKR